MALSNTAVPKYYGQFRDAVLRGEIPVNREIMMEMNRIDALIADPTVFYDEAAVEGYVAYCNNELTLTDGSDLVLLDTFKLWAEQLFGWYELIERTVYEPTPENHGGRYVQKIIKRRLINKQFLIIARGAAKSMYASTVQSYGLNIDRHSTDQIVVAPGMRQANETISPIVTSIVRSRGPYFKFLTAGSINNTTGSARNKVKLASTKDGIKNYLNGSIIRILPLSIDRLQGLRCKYATVDEWLSGDTREDPIGAIEQGASKQDDYLIVATSSEGTVRNGVGDTIKMELMAILKGEYRAKNVSIWYYKLDDISEVAHPELWIKANPNLGATVSYEVYQKDVERAEAVPATRNDILAKRFGIPMEGYTYFFTYEETLPSSKPCEFWGMPCSVGVDLSQGDDFCAITFLFPLPDGSFGIKVHSFITSRTMALLPIARRLKYEEFMKEGTLTVYDSTTIDIKQVYDDMNRIIEYNKYEPRAMGYDPYNAKVFVENWEIDYGPYAVEKVIQGRKTESVPLGEIKQLAEDRKLIFNEQLMTFTMGNAVVLEDVNRNRMLMKKRHEDKIDNVAALMDAYVAYKLHKEEFA